LRFLASKTPFGTVTCWTGFVCENTQGATPMDLFSTQFLAALAAIIVIDLVLAGDNAIVIALAARNLPDRLRKRAILWGTAGAIGVRAAMTIAVVWLLTIPGLMFAGGVMLLWIAYRLLAPGSASDGGEHAKAAGSFWGAMGTIVVADAMMGLDNVLAVAGAAHGSYLLVILGLLISIPIVVWGSQLVLKLIDRFPAIIYLGAGVLAATAAKMITDEPAVRLALSGERALVYAVYVVLVAGVLALAALRNRFRRQDALQSRLLGSAPQPLAAAGTPGARVLVPIDGSRRALEAVHVIAQRPAGSAPAEVHLVNVQHPLSRHIAGFLRRADIAAWQREQGGKALKAAAELLTRLGIPHVRHVRVGPRAGTIARTAQELGCERIVMATARRNSLTRLLDDSVTERVLAHTDVPMEIVPTPHRSPLEAFGYAASLAAAVGIAAAMFG
jgi:YjbE family integral membrane protein